MLRRHVDEAARELVAKLGVIAATTPLPILPAGRTLLVLVVARARVKTALRARACNRVGHCCAGDGIDERCFS